MRLFIGLIRAKLKETKTMKKMLILVAIALIAAPAFAVPLTKTAPTPMSLAIPVQMLIDKTVTLSVDPPVITLTAQTLPLGPIGTGVYEGVTVVSMTHNFPVTVNAVIAPVGPSLGPAATYLCGLSDVSIVMPFGPLSNTLTYNTPAPAPSGRVFFLGAEVIGANIDYITSSTTPQQVAQVILTVTDVI
jgi:hypothetical protein